MIDQNRRRYVNELCVENWKFDKKLRFDHRIFSQNLKRLQNSKLFRDFRYCEYDDENKKSNTKIERKKKRFSKNNNHFEQILHLCYNCIKILFANSCFKLFYFLTLSSINSLLALFFVIIIFYCQTFSIEYMTHQFLQTFSSTILSIEIFNFDLHISKTIFFSLITNFIMTNFSSSTISQMIFFSILTWWLITLFSCLFSNYQVLFSLRIEMSSNCWNDLKNNVMSTICLKRRNSKNFLDIIKKL